MICFDVFRNNERLCRAGIGDAGVLSTILTWTGRQGDSGPARSRLNLVVGGLHNPAPTVDAYLRWVELFDLQPGDEITIRIVESPEADAPSSEERTPHE
ncbi:MAG TPA: hypothetical protein VFE33_30645 [Thermoanaerobaculia bacterium]|nr:hypothetical protein [Thermoanaerobaculia bacterium]